MSAGHHRHLYVETPSRLHDWAPDAKLVGLVGFVVLLATTNAFSTPVFLAGAAIVLGAAVVAGLSVGQVLVRAVPAAPFLVLAALIPVISSSAEATGSATSLAAKIAIGVVASVVFAATTRPTELVQALQKLRVPAVIVSIVSFMFRYLDVMVGEVGRIRVALVSRGYNPTWLKQARPMASAGGAMFVRSFERGERVHAAMLARGFDGALPANRSQPSASPAMWILALAPAMLIAILRVAT